MQPDRPLTPRESVFAELVADHTDTRSISEKTLAAGWRGRKHGYEVLRRPHVAARIEALVEQSLRAIRARRGAVLNALVDRAVGDGREANEAARIYLQATGDIGTGGITNVNALSNHGTLEDRVRADELRERSFPDRLRALETSKALRLRDREERRSSQD